VQTWADIKDIVSKYISTEFKLLNVGCGNSLLSVQMQSDGYRHIENIDYSQVVIDLMNLKNQDIIDEDFCCNTST